ncbi:unnamed protein product [Prorocentrum cordatum]|uniref:EF-hand domain-containing protein n=1 Tax=Prorocentrum cordatum TaxID=2364126 RepID=A0ABN9QZ52_9DINO|nr:unnamed protein product [Polarella glacialis]
MWLRARWRIFVEIANHWALNDKSSREQAATEQRLGSLKSLFVLFEEMDPGGHGTLTLERMQEALLDVDSRLVSSFHALGLEVTDVRTLFLLLDRDRKGFINVDEFLLGCFRLKGEARTLDIMKLQYQCEFIMHNLVNVVDMLSRRDVDMMEVGSPGCVVDSGAGSQTDFRNFSAAVVSKQLREVLNMNGSAVQSSARHEGSESPGPREMQRRFRSQVTM